MQQTLNLSRNTKKIWHDSRVEIEKKLRGNGGLASITGWG